MTDDVERDPNDAGWLADVVHDAYDGSPLEIAIAVLAAIRETHAIVPIAEAKELLANADSDPCELGYQRDVATFLSAMIAAAEGEG